jgi:hypothetical protein
MLRGTKLDTGTYLDKIKSTPQSDQVKRVRADLAALRSAPKAKASRSAKIDADVKARAAREVAEIIAEHVPPEWWDGVKANPYSAGARNIADALSSVVGESRRPAA